ncbi:hypothetical protein F4678DRAFT_427442 [Xylaria arbuscula]|nr:hypothetical protein F4678DRAFT_427442 [Xylaria arbuscula]
MARTKMTARTTHNYTQPLIGCWYPFSDPSVPFCIQMLKCWYGSLQYWRLWHPKLESLIPRLPYRAETFT